MLEGVGRFWKTDTKLYIYVPAVVLTDSKFPLTGKKGNVKIKIEDGKIIVEKA